jgi:hypothetical protein
MIGTTVRGAGAAVGHIDPTWRTPERRGWTSVGMRQEHTVLEVSQRLRASTTVVDPMLSWFHTTCGGWNHGVEAGAVHSTNRPSAGDGT